MATDHPSTPDPSTPLEDTTDTTPDPEPTDLVPAPQPPVADPSSLPQPDPIEPRPYIEIRPAETPVDPGAVIRAFELIDQRLREYTQTGLRHKLKGTTLQPIIEFLLVADGRPDTSIRYLVGTNVTDLTEDLDGICRTAFPNSYEFKYVSYHPRFIEEHLPLVHTPDPPTRPLYDKHERDGPQHPAITPATSYVAGVEYFATCDRVLDWQTPLTPFDEFVGPRYVDRPHTESRRVPLATLIESMGDADCPVIFQVVAMPYADWSSSAEMHRKELDHGTVTRGDKLIETIFPRDRGEKQRYTPPKADQDRIDGIDRRSPARTFLVSARAAVLTRTQPSTADTIARRLAGDLTPLSGD